MKQEDIADKIAAASDTSFWVFTENPSEMVGTLKRHRSLVLYAESTAYVAMVDNLLTIETCKVFSFVTIVCGVGDYCARDRVITVMSNTCNYKSRVVAVLQEYSTWSSYLNSLGPSVAYVDCTSPHPFLSERFYHLNPKRIL